LNKFDLVKEKLVNDEDKTMFKCSMEMHKDNFKILGIAFADYHEMD